MELTNPYLHLEGIQNNSEKYISRLKERVKKNMEMPRSKSQLLTDAGRIISFGTKS